MSSRARSNSHDSAIGDSDDDELPDIREVINTRTQRSNHRNHTVEPSPFSTDDEYEDRPSRRRARASAAADVPIAAPELATETAVPLEGLDDDQKKVVRLVVQRRINTCVIGRAGTGKSTVIDTICREARKKELRVRLAAPSGTTALNIGGQTIHAFAGLGGKLNRGLKYYEQKAKTPRMKSRMSSTDILIVDEISMISNELLERLDKVMKAARSSSLPFGGVQLVLIGDPCQLPPVQPFEYCIQCGRKRADDRTGYYECETHGRVHIDDQWIWKAPAFVAVDFKFVELRVSHRQQEPEFQAILDKVYRGDDLSDGDIGLLENHDLEDGVVELFARKQEVNECNDDHFDDLIGTVVPFKCHDHYVWRKALHPDLKELTYKSGDGTLMHLGQHKYQSKLELKTGMPVMLLRNLDTDKGLVNGSQGIIIAWYKYTEKNLPRGTANPSDHDGDVESQRPASNQGDRPMYGSNMANLRLDQMKRFMERNLSLIHI